MTSNLLIDAAKAIVGAVPIFFRPMYAGARGTRPNPSDFATTQTPQERLDSL
jgi:hypothetical protein